ncbi:hypothetical protein MPDQ_005337 [Monascus purpureus]|uniref:Uncharacterized protein n=1 Tax=Monascus purpureus TaxID=5098 RepID=A0A507QG89_MONPU|nr:hypothetical protein MPDQ_005337 [Monascus purpureus]BDD54381.1 hypothetical protein MAP00_000004 [Monascus purpureus]
MDAKTSASCDPTVIMTRLRELSSQAATIVRALKYGRVQLGHEEYKSLEAASLDLNKTVVTVTEEVKLLGRRRKDAIVAEGQKLLSQAEHVKSDMMRTNELKNRVIFIWNMQLFFNPPEESKLDSPPVQKRKKLTRERCEIIHSLSLSAAIIWAAAFPPSAWDSNIMSKSLFDYVIEFLTPGKDEKELRYPASLYEILMTLAAEQPLQNSTEFEAFLASEYATKVLSKED